MKRLSNTYGLGGYAMRGWCEVPLCVLASLHHGYDPCCPHVIRLLELLARRFKGGISELYVSRALVGRGNVKEDGLRVVGEGVESGGY